MEKQTKKIILEVGQNPQKIIKTLAREHFIKGVEKGRPKSAQSLIEDIDIEIKRPKYTHNK